MAIEDFRRPIELEVPIVEDGRHAGWRWLETPVQHIPDSDIASLPLPDRITKLKQLQHVYLEPHLKRESPLLFDKARPDSVGLALTLEDFQMREYEARYAQARYQTGRRKTAEERVKTAENLRNTVIDSFVQDFFLKPEGINRLYLAIDDIITHTDFSEKDIARLISSAKNRLHKLQSDEHARLFCYKEGSDNLTTPRNAEILYQTMETAFSPIDKKSEIDRQIHTTAEALLDFYWHNYKNLYPALEITPLVAFSHDYFFAAALSGNPDFFVLASDWLVKRLQRNKEAFFAELNTNYQFFQIEVEMLVNKLQKEQAKRRPEGSLIDFIATPDEDFIEEFLAENRGRFMIGQHYDRNIGIESTFNLLAEFKRPHLYNEGAIVTAARSTDQPTTGELEQRVNSSLVAFDWRKVISGYAKDFYLLDALVSLLMSKERYLDIIAPLASMSKGSLRTSEWYERSLTQFDFKRIREPARTITRTNLALNAMFIESAPDNAHEVGRLHKRNQELTNKIRDFNVWFVATNGDSFPVESNPELAGLKITNLTFYPDRQSGGHRIEFVTSLKDREEKVITFTIFLDRYGKAFYGNRNPLVLNLYLTAAMENLAMKYLYYITSGAASKAGEVIVRDQTGVGQRTEQPDLFIHRRHHYRHLPADPTKSDRVYTLQSPEAKAHRDFVLAKYGIDIYEEILRRRRAGTLARNQVVTFVKEVENENVPPNILSYQD